MYILSPTIETLGVDIKSVSPPTIETLGVHLGDSPFVEWCIRFTTVP